MTSVSSSFGLQVYFKVWFVISEFVFQKCCPHCGNIRMLKLEGDRWKFWSLTPDFLKKINSERRLSFILTCCPFPAEFKNSVFFQSAGSWLEHKLTCNNCVHVVYFLTNHHSSFMIHEKLKFVTVEMRNSERKLRWNPVSYFFFSVIYENMCSEKRSHECHLMKSRLHCGGGGCRGKLVTVSQESRFINPRISS